MFDFNDLAIDELDDAARDLDSRSRVDVAFNPGNFTAAAVNDAIETLHRDYGGGVIKIDGEGIRLNQDEPIVRLPGIELFGVGVPSVSGNDRTTLVPKFSGPQLVQDNGQSVERKEAWGASSVHHLTLRNHDRRPGVTGLEVWAGNNSPTHDIAMQRDYEYGIHVVDVGQKAGGQYSRYDRINMWGAKYPLWMERKCPDLVYTNCMFYGTGWHGGATGPEAGSVGVHVEDNSVRFQNCESQFCDISWQFAGREIYVNGGATEHLAAWTPGAADTFIHLQAGARKIVFNATSFANINRGRNVFRADDDVKYVSVRDPLSLRPVHIDAKHQKWFTFLEE